MNVLKEFEQLGNRASFHFAGPLDEQQLGYSCQVKALKIFDENSELQEDMRKIAKGFLWSLDLVRPEENSCG